MTAEEKIKHIKAYPEQHRHHDFEDIAACATIDGVMDLAVYDAHAGVYGTNGGVGCDVVEGPCSCGGWH